MTFELALATESEKVKWDEMVDASQYSSAFHRWEWLKLAEKYSGSQLIPIFIKQGTNVIAVYPVFLFSRLGIKIGISPPSNLYIPYLGPVIIGYEDMKQNRREHLLIETQKLLNHYLFQEKKCNIVRIRTSPPLLDSRPLRWCGYSIEPLYTYRIDLRKGCDEVWNKLDRKLRVTINKQARDGIVVERGEKEDIAYLHAALARRYSEQGISTKEHLQYLQELFTVFAPDHLQIWVARMGEERVGGMMTICHHGGCSLWIGIPKSPNSSGNELVQWEAIRWACNEGYSWYEEMDAGDNPRLRHFKSKYNPDLIPWYSAIRYSSPVFRVLYNLVRK
jgi:hypothetical protein